MKSWRSEIILKKYSAFGWREKLFAKISKNWQFYFAGEMIKFEAQQKVDEAKHSEKIAFFHFCLSVKSFMRKKQIYAKNRFFKRKACETDHFSLHSENKFILLYTVPTGLRREF
jgi:hypothetical protein